MLTARCEKLRWWGSTVRGTPLLAGAGCRGVVSWRWNTGTIHCETTAANTGLLEKKRLQMRCWRGESVRETKSASQYHRPGTGWIG